MTSTRGQAIRAMRGPLTQTEFGELVGVNQARVSIWENGGEINLENANRLVELGLDVAYVLPAAAAATAPGELSPKRGAA